MVHLQIILSNLTRSIGRTSKIFEKLILWETFNSVTVHIHLSEKSELKVLYVLVSVSPIGECNVH